MLENKFESLGTFSKLTTRKRVRRAVFGIALIAYFFWRLPRYSVLAGEEFPLNPGLWIGAAILFYFFGDVFNIGFNRRWRLWPQGIFVGLLAAAVALDFFLYGGFWGAPAGWLIFLMQQFTAAMIGIGFLISAALASPG